jgi:hypothetical protein
MARIMGLAPGRWQGEQHVFPEALRGHASKETPQRWQGRAFVG